MNISPASESGVAGRSVCFIHTSPAMVHLLTGAGPDAMGGAELQMYLLGHELSRRGWDVAYLVGDYGQDAADSPGGFRVEAVKPGRDGTLPGTVRALRRFWKALANVDADIYVTRGLTAQTGVVAAFAQWHRRHSVFWFGKDADALYAVPRRSGLPIAERIPAWYGMRHASAVVCQTSQQLELLRAHAGRSGVLIRNVTPWDPAASDGGACGPVLWVGSIQPKKRPRMVLEIAARLPHVQFVMIGGKMKGHERLYEATVAGVAQLPNVEYLGFVPHTEIAQYFQAAAMLVSTSDGRQEGFPNVFLQAWSTGLPVAATCDPDGIIRDHGLGCHCESASELVEAISRFRENPDIHNAIAGRARGYVRKHHSAERVGGQLDSLLSSLQKIGVVEVADGQTTL